MKKQIAAACSVIFILLLSAAVAALRSAPFEKRIARIYQNGVLIREINLDDIESPKEFTAEDESGHTNIIRAEKGRIRMADADCPDKTCVKQGWIENAAVPIVCLPNKVTIEITGTGSADARIGGA